MLPCSIYTWLSANFDGIVELRLLWHYAATADCDSPETRQATASVNVVVMVNVEMD